MKHTARNTTYWRLCGLAFLLSSPAFAHTPYLAPSTFELDKGKMVTLDASFAEKFFVPEHVFDQSTFSITKPDGKIISPDNVTQFKLRTVVEHQLKDQGTYRFSTGERLGKVFKLYLLDGERKSLENPQDPLPKGATPLAFFQSLTRAETYVTKGKPSASALVPHNKGLELAFNSSPNELFAGEANVINALFNGESFGSGNLDKLTVDIYLAKDQFSDSKPLHKLITDEQGQIIFTPPEQGVYLLRARHKSAAPKGAKAPTISNTYTLVLEVID